MDDPAATNSPTPPGRDTDLSPQVPNDDERVCAECGGPIGASDITCPHCGAALVGG